jgi:acyl-CoA thioester hydrolase
MSIREGADPQRPWPERVEVEGKRVRTAFRVRYAETDQMGMAYYANYLVWFEVMRGDFMRAVGTPYRALEEQGYLLPIVEAHVRYLAPARYDDPVEIVAWIEDLRSRRITFGYRVERAGDLLATGWTTHVPVGRDGKARGFSRELLDTLEPYITGTAPAEAPGR